MEIYKYEFSLVNGKISVLGYEIYDCKSYYQIRGKTQKVSKNRLKEFTTFKKGTRLIAWSLSYEMESEFKQVCIAKLQTMILEINEKYNNLICQLGGE